MKRFLGIVVCSVLAHSVPLFGASNVIEKQLEEIGSIPNDEVVVVQRKYTRKIWRHELSPIGIGGIPFGTVRRTLFAGASYTLHFNDWFAWEGLNFAYAKNFFSSFTDDINVGQIGAGTDCQTASRPCVKPDIQKLLYLLTTGIQITPFYGKFSTFSRWIAYIEPYFGLGAGVAKTETAEYLTYYPSVGLRVFFREWFSMRAEFRDYLYTEKFQKRDASGGEASALRNNYAVNVAFSFWLPKMPR